MPQHLFRTHRRGRRPRRPLRWMIAGAGWVQVLGTARAPFRAGVRGSPSSQAGRAWKPTPTMCGECFGAEPAPCVDRRRGVGDAAPYGWVRNVSCGIVVNSCAIAANLLPRTRLPFQGSRGGWVRCGGVVRRPTVGCGATTLSFDRRVSPPAFPGRRRCRRRSACPGGRGGRRRVFRSARRTAFRAGRGGGLWCAG